MTREEMIHRRLHKEADQRELRNYELRILQLEEKELELKQAPGFLTAFVAVMYLIVVGIGHCFNAVF